MFGDLPWDVWCSMEGPQEEPWPLFRAAWTARKNRDLGGCCALLEQVTAMVDVETRHQVQAWHYLRELGRAAPEAGAKDVLGVIIEKGLPEGTEVLGAYEDHTARFWGADGIGILWPRASANLDDEFDALFAVAHVAVRKIKPRIGAHPPVPGLGEIQISFLTPSGIHLGTGSAAILPKDPLAKSLVDRGAALVDKLLAQRKDKP